MFAGEAAAQVPDTFYHSGRTDTVIGLSINIPLGEQSTTPDSRTSISFDFEYTPSPRPNVHVAVPASELFVDKRRRLRLTLEKEPRLYLGHDRVFTFGERRSGESDHGEVALKLNDWETAGVVVGGILVVSAALVLAAGGDCLISDRRCEDEN